ncbi:MAG: hypothetical protein KME55_27490 [Nostoc indistinguendum CM1-VF10]|nr:hypothetical protein [Nostoc indistinguendum CM1-VF10]
MPLLCVKCVGLAHRRHGLTALTNDGFGNINTIKLIENVIGSRFKDTLIGDSNVNSILGGDGNDIIEGKEGSDRLFGENGNDEIFGGTGDDYLIGGTGTGWPSDILDGGTGNDTASYITATSGVAASLAEGTGWQGDATGDKFISIENLEGSSYNDFLIGDNSNNILTGLAGNDTLEGRAGDDGIDPRSSNAVHLSIWIIRGAIAYFKKCDRFLFQLALRSLRT